MHKSFFAWLDESRKNIAYILIIFIVFAVIFRLGIGTKLHSAFFSKTNLGFFNFAHAFLGVATMAAISTMVIHNARWIEKLLTNVGKNTLECYAMSIPITYILGGVWLNLPNNLSSYILVNALVIAGVLITTLMKSHLNRAHPTLNPIRSAE